MIRIICNEPERIGRFVSDQTGVEDWTNYKAIGLEKDGRLIAAAVYDNYTKATIFMHIAIVQGERLTRNFLWYMFHYPFNELGVKGLRGMIPESNKDSIKFAEGLKGAQLEARLKDAHPDGDMLIYRMFKQDCKYLGIYRNEA